MNIPMSMREVVGDEGRSVDMPGKRHGGCGSQSVRMLEAVILLCVVVGVVISIDKLRRLETLP